MGGDRPGTRAKTRFGARQWRGQALQTKDPQERQELLRAAREMDKMAADLAS